MTFEKAQFRKRTLLRVEALMAKACRQLSTRRREVVVDLLIWTSLDGGLIGQRVSGDPRRTC